MLKIALALAALSFGSFAFALSFEEAGENLTYFVYAQQAAAHCEEEGVRARVNLSAWSSKHKESMTASMDAVKARGKRAGLDAAGQDQFLAVVLGRIGKETRDSINRKGVYCQDFGAVLNGLTHFLKQ